MARLNNILALDTYFVSNLLPSVSFKGALGSLNKPWKYIIGNRFLAKNSSDAKGEFRIQNNNILNSFMSVDMETYFKVGLKDINANAWLIEGRGLKTTGKISQVLVNGCIIGRGRSGRLAGYFTNTEIKEENKLDYIENFRFVENAAESLTLYFTGNNTIINCKDNILFKRSKIANVDLGDPEVILRPVYGGLELINNQNDVDNNVIDDKSELIITHRTTKKLSVAKTQLLLSNGSRTDTGFKPIIEYSINIPNYTEKYAAFQLLEHRNDNGKNANIFLSLGNGNNISNTVGAKGHIYLYPGTGAGELNKAHIYTDKASHENHIAIPDASGVVLLGFANQDVTHSDHMYGYYPEGLPGVTSTLKSEKQGNLCFVPTSKGAQPDDNWEKVDVFILKK